MKKKKRKIIQENLFRDGKLFLPSVTARVTIYRLVVLDSAVIYFGHRTTTRARV